MIDSMISMINTEKTIDKTKKVTSISLKDRFVTFLRKNPAKKYTIKQLFDQYPFNNSMEKTRVTIELAFKEGLIKSTITDAGVTYHT